MTLLLYLLLAICVVLLSIKLSFYVDLLDKKTDISGAFIGGVMLAAVTSLPEFFTSLSSTIFLDKPGLVMGNILGSNLFNLTALSAIALIFFTAFKKASIGRSHITTLKCTVTIYILLTLGAYFNFDPFILFFSLYSIAIAVVYYVGIKTMSNDDGLENVEEEAEVPLTIAQIGRRFTLASILLVAFSIAITFVTDRLAIEYNMGTTFAGALLLGVATSLPELASSVNLARLGNFNAMTGNILGSNLFNFFIMSIADFTYFRGSVYLFTKEGFALLSFGLVAHFATAFVVSSKIMMSPESQMKRNFTFILPNIIVIVCYMLFIASSM